MNNSKQHTNEMEIIRFRSEMYRKQENKCRLSEKMAWQ